MCVATQDLFTIDAATPYGPSWCVSLNMHVLQVALHDQVGGCQNFWRAKPEYVQKYNLTTVVPQDVQEVLAVARARHRPRRGGGKNPLMCSIPCQSAGCALAHSPACGQTLYLAG